MDPSFRLDSQPWQKEPGDDESLPCVCCQGTGVHEKYNHNTDWWEQQDCIPCKGTGYMTPTQIREWKKQCDGIPY
jgi:DnaJ-class molecular chaperone